MLAYQTAVSELYQLGHELHKLASSKFDLKHMRVLCEALGSPQTRFPSVLIAGTNGKGSTAATLDSILRSAGYKTGLYTSPHLVRINERVRVAGESISNKDFAAIYDCVHKLAAGLVADGRLPWHPSFFETMTALAFEYFAREQVQIAVVEVGMGGRLDATNILEPLVSVITDIDFDHQKFLGNTLGEIAGEKAGIMRRGGPVVTLPQHPEVNARLGQAVVETGAVPVNAARYVAAVSPRASELVQQERGRTQFAMSVIGEEVEIETPLAGRHQLRNLALAIATAEELTKRNFAISPRQIAEGIRHTCWPGRFQVLEATAGGSRPEIVIDVAHNPAGAWALRAGLSERFEGRKFVLVFGAMRDKAVREMGRILFPLAEKVVLCKPAGNPRAASTAELAEATADSGTPLLQAPDVAGAVQQAFAEARALDGDIVVVITGSIYVVGEAMQALELDAARPGL